MRQVLIINQKNEEAEQIAKNLGETQAEITCVSSIGNRHYVAMQSFMYPYSKSLIYGESEERARRAIIKKDIMAQLSSKLSSNSSMPTVQRKIKNKRSGQE